MPMRWSSAEDEILKSEYSLSRIDDLANKLCRTRSAIYNRAYKLGLHRAVYGNKELITSFDNWSENMAYCLGFIMADGCVHDGGKGDRRLIIKLAYRDRSHLVQIKDFIYQDAKIRIFYEKIKDRRYKQCALQICSKYLYNRLLDLGVCPKKSLVCKFPHIPEQFGRHFVRGYFDGDGSIYKLRGTNKWKTSFVGTAHFLNGIATLLNKHVGVEYKHPKCYKSKIYEIKYGKSDSRKICDWLYQDSNIKLDRKYNKYLDLIGEIGE